MNSHYCETYGTFSLFYLLLFTVASFTLTTDRCLPKKFEGAQSVVCVCNKYYCDTYEHLGNPDNKGQYFVFTSSKDGHRLQKRVENFIHEKRTVKSFQNLKATVLQLDRAKVYQTIYGFGGSFTDAAAINYFKLSESTRAHLIKSYYSSDIGIGFTYGRVPVGGTDFSTRIYTYDDQEEDDLALKNFRLAEEDFNLKIPMIKDAQAVARKPLKLIGAPWFAPAWIKKNPKPLSSSHIKGSPGGPYYKAWANYIVKFLDAYKKHNVTFWGMSPQNEPYVAETYNFSFVPYDAETMRDYIASDFGPALHIHGYADLKILILDDTKEVAFSWAKEIFANNSALNYTSGVAVHGYDFVKEVYATLSEIHNCWPDKFILLTEYSLGSPSDPTGQGMRFGSWDRAVDLSHKIIQLLRHWSVGWVDWNLALDMEDGPNSMNITVDSPIIVDSENDQFFKQPLFYVLAHFSKFLPPGSTVFDMQSQTSTELEFVGAETPEKKTVVVVSNKLNHSVEVIIKDSKRDEVISTTLSAFSITTFVW